MKIKRRLSMETLERRLVLDGVGLNAVIVCLNDDVGDPEAMAKGLVNAHGGQLGHVYEYAVKGFSAQLPDAALEALLKNPHVKRIEPDIPMQALEQDLPTGVDRIDGESNLVAKINGIDERVDVDIAIIDSGIDIDHPDLNVVGGVNTILATSSYNDVYGHGTHVAGIAAALDNETGVVGVAPGARLWAVKVLNDRGRGNVSDIIEGIDWVTANAGVIEVANMSLGGQGVNVTYQEAIRESVAAGVVYVVAAGNSSAEIYGSDKTFGTSDDFIPAAYPEVATISAFADSDGLPGGLGEDTSWDENGQDDAWWRMSNFSNSDLANVAYYGSGTVTQPVVSDGLGIDLVMPGVDIYSTYPGGGYRTMSGTSMASPHAAGLAALYIASHGRATNAAEVYNIRQALINGGKDWYDSAVGIINPDGYYIGGTPDSHTENLGWAGQVADSVPPLAPTGLVVSVPISNGDVLELDWADNEETDLVGYQVWRSDNGGASYVQIASSVAESQYTDTGLENLTTYCYRVTAVDFSSNVSGYSQVVSATTVDILPPAAPSNLSASAGNGQVVLDWADNTDSDLNEYRVYRRVGNESFAMIASSGNTSTFTDTNVANGTMYYYVVTAVDRSSHESPNSNEASATPTDVITTMHVSDLEATSANQAKWWTASVTVTVHNTAGIPVANATIIGSWSGGITGTAAGLSNADGVYTFTKTKISKTVGSVIFTVANVTGSLTYAPADNHDLDGDSNGTSIEVSKPLHVAQESLNNQLVGDLLTPTMVNSVMDAAVSYWADAGVAPDRVDMLRGVDVEIVDLDGSLLGLAYSNWITLDRDAAGYGWMAADAHAGGSLHSGAVDLFSAVTHEFGHLLGFEHNDRQDDLMASTLLMDARPLPVAAGIVPRDNTGTVLVSSVLLPLTRFDALDYELPDRVTGIGGAQDITTTDIDGLPLPLCAADYTDRPRSSSRAVDFHVLRGVDDDETELLDDDLLALLAASRS